MYKMVPQLKKRLFLYREKLHFQCAYIWIFNFYRVYMWIDDIQNKYLSLELVVVPDIDVGLLRKKTKKGRDTVFWLSRIRQ